MNILFVCLGNICRSPMAEGILRQKFRDNGIAGLVESAGFESYHINEPPDDRAIETAKAHGIDIRAKRAKLFSSEDFDRFDRIYVMDEKNFRDISFFIRNDQDKAKVDFVMNLLEPGRNSAVPDPYYRRIEACEEVFGVLSRACDVIINRIKDGSL